MTQRRAAGTRPSPSGYPGIIHISTGFAPRQETTMQDDFESGTQHAAASGRDAAEKVQEAGARARAGASEIGDEARRTAGKVQDEIAAAAESVKEQVGEAAQTVKQRARAMADDQKTAGAEQLGGLARAINQAADELQDEMPQAAGFVREAATRVDNVSHMIRERSIEDLVQGANNFARTNTIAFFGMSLVAGFALSRFLKSSAPSAHAHQPQPSAPPYPHAQHPHAQPHPMSESASAPPERVAAFPSSQF
jgi:vacuolar-type H+-ATPase subunit E/Vma4